MKAGISIRFLPIREAEGKKKLPPLVSYVRTYVCATIAIVFCAAQNSLFQRVGLLCSGKKRKGRRRHLIAPLLTRGLSQPSNCFCWARLDPINKQRRSRHGISGFQRWTSNSVKSHMIWPICLYFGSLLVIYTVYLLF